MKQEVCLDYTHVMRYTTRLGGRQLLYDTCMPPYTRYQVLFSIRADSLSYSIKPVAMYLQFLLNYALFSSAGRSSSLTRCYR